MEYIIKFYYLGDRFGSSEEVSTTIVGCALGQF